MANACARSTSPEEATSRSTMPAMPHIALLDGGYVSCFPFSYTDVSRRARLMSASIDAGQNAITAMGNHSDGRAVATHAICSLPL
jgi:hypothetical protein